ncbi:MAG TPA: DNA ligase D [Steroidobacteraceae bacterium]|nr:DNA ligase D [Steroidobacteraceae bacterium]
MADAGQDGKSRLKRYAAKRNFSKTVEPSHAAKATRGKVLSFVVQKHAARRLHWDFRLEWEGTLRSWAVPKGPSLDPADKRLAVEVEDHPLAYAKFEGTIPKGQYGGGQVDLWDKGTWEPVGDFAKGLKKGHLEFEMFGKKLSGRWHLVRTRMQGKQPNWLLMKAGDFAARAGADADVIDAGGADDPKRLLRRVHKAVRRVAPPAKRGRKSSLPTTLKPQLATLVDEVPGDDGWVYELKYDGIRLLCRVDGPDVRCISRNGLDWTKKVGPIVDALAALNLYGSWLDGELIVVDPNGRSDFSLLQDTREQGRLEELRFCVFDALYLDGKDLRSLPLHQRKRKLDAALARLPRNGPLRMADQIHSNSAELLARVCGQHLEGLIAKRVDSIYKADRSPDWLKIKCRREQEFVVGGAAYLASRGTGEWSSLLVGVRSGDRVKYCGRVGGGFNAADRRQWQQRIDHLARPESPFDRLPERRAGEKWFWMKPELVIQVAFADWTTDRILRQPRYLGLREDRDPKTVVLEEPAHTDEVAKATKSRSKRSASTRIAKKGDAQVLGQRLSHPDRVLFPHDGITKLQLAEYFAAVGEHAMPHYQNRPLSILRNTHGSTPFFQKHFLEKASEGLRIVKIPNADKDPDFTVCDSPQGLLHLAQVGAVELHSWGAVMPKPTHADRLTFDLDPGAGLPYPPLREAALAIRKLMKDLGLESWVKTTGGKGLHVVVPLTRPLPDWPKAKEFAREVTLFMERLAPTMFTSKTGERNRRNKIFVDYLRNGFGATAVAAFSPRWRPGVGVSTPVSWDEIDEDIRGTHFNLHNVPDRVAKLRKDPWKGYWSATQAINKTMMKKLEGM